MLRQAREEVRKAGGANIPLVAKLERPEAIARLEEIIRESDAVMVARGDLGLELPFERVPANSEGGDPLGAHCSRCR